MRWLLGLTAGLCALMWLLAAWSKLLDPLAAYELVAVVLGPGAVAKAAVALVIAGEALLGTWMALGLAARRGLAASLIALAGFTGLLVRAEALVGGDVPCGCLPSVLDAGVEQAIVRNVVLCVWIAGLLVAERVLARRTAPVTDPDAAAAPGPATP